MKALRHYCRNPHCRSKLKAPVENLHRAFCCRGCHSSFYRSRCLVCEEQMHRKTELQRFKSGHAVCRAEYHRFPHVYAWELPTPTKCAHDARNAHFTGLEMPLRSGLAPIRAPARVIAAEIFPGPCREVVSSDGVACQVYGRHPTPAAEVTGNFKISEAPISQFLDPGPIPECLRRSA